jgi:hypothetical protein
MRVVQAAQQRKRDEERRALADKARQFDELTNLAQKDRSAFLKRIGYSEADIAKDYVERSGMKWTQPQGAAASAPPQPNEELTGIKQELQRLRSERQNEALAAEERKLLAKAKDLVLKAGDRAKLVQKLEAYDEVKAEGERIWAEQSLSDLKLTTEEYEELTTQVFQTAADRVEARHQERRKRYLADDEAGTVPKAADGTALKKPVPVQPGAAASRPPRPLPKDDPLADIIRKYGKAAQGNNT